MPIELPELEPCPFCRILAGESDWVCAFVHRTDKMASFINPRQYGKGGMLVIPIHHAPTVLDLRGDEIARIYKHAKELVAALSDAFDPSGFNIFQNNGIAAGQTVPHFHVHIVPRYELDEPKKVFSEKEVSPIPAEARLELAATVKQHLVTEF